MVAGRDRSRSPYREVSIVPIIDISGINGDKQEKSAVAKKIEQACTDIGFMVVVNHGVPQHVIDAAWEQTSSFFDQPLQDKMKCGTDDEEKYPYGYSALGGEVLSVGKALEKGPVDEKENTGGDLKEMFAIGPKNPAAGMLPRRLPQAPAGFADAFEAYYDAMDNLAQKLLQCFEIALDLPEGWFDSKVDRHISALRANNYPSQDGMSAPAGSIRCSAHTDYGTITILRSGGPGLQVSKDKENPMWHDVPFVEDGFVINLGDLMRRWTNERWSSTLHRVINPPKGKENSWGRRMALAFFQNLNKDALVEAIPSCVSEANPVLYDPIVAGEFLMLKHLASNGKADKDAHFKRRSGAQFVPHVA